MCAKCVCPHPHYILFCCSAVCCWFHFYFPFTDNLIQYMYMYLNRETGERENDGHKRSAHQRQCLINIQHTTRYQEDTPCFYTPSTCCWCIIVVCVWFFFVSLVLNLFRPPFVSLLRVQWQLRAWIEFRSARVFFFSWLLFCSRRLSSIHPVVRSFVHSFLNSKRHLKMNEYELCRGW